jgi:hypothetical protein
LRTSAGKPLARAAATLIHHCREGDAVDALLARAATLTLEDDSEPFELWAPLAQTAAYCDPRSERVLAGWLEVDTARRRAAARALAATASRTRRLEASTVVALLRHPEFEETWFALSHLDAPSPSLRERVLEQGIFAFETGSVRAYWVLRALGKTGAGAAALLERILADPKHERAYRLAARASLAELGQLPLGATLPDLDEGVAASDERRAELHFLETFERERARELGPDARFSRALAHADAVVVERALAVFSKVPERPERDEALRAALLHANPGVVAAAATTLGHVARARPSEAPSRETVQALKDALLGRTHEHAVPTRIALLEAVGTLQVLSLKGVLRELCTSPIGSVRAALNDALVQLRDAPCPVPSASSLPSPSSLPSASPAASAGVPAGHRIRIEIGERVLHVELDPELPAIIADQLRSFVDGGGFDDTRVAVESAGTWVRIGDPEGDAYPNGRKPPFVSLPGGEPFERGSVALWQHGPDAASLELVVMLEDRPDLDADHTRVGTATGDWAPVRDGATLTKARIEAAK